MDLNKQNKQEQTTTEQIPAEHTSVHNAKKKKLTGGKVLAVVIGAVVVVYLFFNVHLFYNFVRIMLSDPDAAKQQGTAAEALDEIYDGGEE